MPDKVQSLPFGDQVAASSALSPAADQVVEPEAGRALVPCLDADDPDADLDRLSNQDLRRHVDELKTSRDRRHDVVLRC